MKCRSVIEKNDNKFCLYVFIIYIWGIKDTYHKRSLNFTSFNNMLPTQDAGCLPYVPAGIDQ